MVFKVPSDPNYSMTMTLWVVAPQDILVHGIVPPKVQDFALPFVEHYSDWLDHL